MRSRVWVLFAGSCLVLSAVACGGGDQSDDAAQTSPSSSPASDGHTGHTHDAGSAVLSYAFTLGKPAGLETASRTLKIRTKAGFRYAPKDLSVAAGETVAFEVTNDDKVAHEVVLGNKAYQMLHENQMQAGGVYHDYSAYSVHVAPGSTLSFAWTFEKPGKIQFACHLPGHFSKGMIGRIEIT